MPNRFKELIDRATILYTPDNQDSWKKARLTILEAAREALDHKMTSDECIDILVESDSLVSFRQLKRSMEEQMFTRTNKYEKI